MTTTTKLRIIAEAEKRNARRIAEHTKGDKK